MCPRTEERLRRLFPVAVEEGIIACQDGLTCDENPYPITTDKGMAWYLGWHDANIDAAITECQRLPGVKSMVFAALPA